MPLFAGTALILLMPAAYAVFRLIISCLPLLCRRRCFYYAMLDDVSSRAALMPLIFILPP